MKKNPDEIEFICPKCKTRERIPTEIVEMLDYADQIGVDTSVPLDLIAKIVMVKWYLSTISGQKVKFTNIKKTK